MATELNSMNSHFSVTSEDVWGKPRPPREVALGRPPRAFGKDRATTLVCLSLLWVSGQIPIYMYGSSSPYVYRDIGGVDIWSWYVIANLFAMASVCPFFGSVADLIGRRYVALLGSLLVVIGMIVCSTARRMPVFIAGMAISGSGSGICELIALAVIAEQSPAKDRGKYATILVFSILPFTPSILWAQLIASKAGWRYIGALCGAMAAAAFVMTALFFRPPPTLASRGLSKRERFRRIDFLGGGLFIGGVLLFTSGLQFGSINSWDAPRTYSLLTVGSFIFLLFLVWEIRLAKNPMLPPRLRKSPRILLITLCVTFVAGAQFTAVLLIFPTQSYNQFGQDPVAVGIRGSVIGFSLLVGAIVVLWLLYTLNGYNRIMIVVSCVMMTAGTGSLAALGPDDVNALWAPLIIAGMGIGGIYVPSIIIVQMACPDELLGVGTASTISLRILGGAIGFSAYYSVFILKFKVFAFERISEAMQSIGISNIAYIIQAVELTGNANLDQIKLIPGLANETSYSLVIKAGQVAYAESYKYVYLISLAFGIVATIASLLLGDVEKFMDDHVAIIVA